MDEYINPIDEGVLSWKSISSFTSDLEESPKQWKQSLHEVSTRKCGCITYTLRWIRYEVCDPTKYDGITYIDHFLK
jgi:hypothetical protein